MKTSSKIILGALSGVLSITLCYSILHNKADIVHALSSPAQKQKTTTEKKPVKPTLPLGETGLEETRQTTTIAPGLTYTKITRGKSSDKDTYIIDVAFRATKKEAQSISDRLRSQGYEARVEPAIKTSSDGSTQAPMGYLVRIGNFPLEVSATQLRDQLVKKGYPDAKVIAFVEEPTQTTGPWIINILTIDPKNFKGKLQSELSKNIVPGEERLTTMAVRTHALAAINGGYFRDSAFKTGIEGDPTGISVIGGTLVSEARDNQVGLILSAASIKATKIASLKTTITVTTAAGIKRNIDGVDRAINANNTCPQTTNTGQTQMKANCVPAGEIVLFNEGFGTTTESGDGIEAVINASGTVIAIRNKRGGSIPPNGSVLAGTGQAANWIRSHILLHTKVKIDTKVLANDLPLAVNKNMSIINGGSLLLKDGNIFVSAAANPDYQNTSDAAILRNAYYYANRRNPRTIAGIKPDGTMILVTIDGRRPGYSVGITLLEGAKLMKALGATEAINLDGGGSTGMVIGGHFINAPSDITGERPIGDGLLILP